jgi:flagellar hook-associated protein 3 FlgL
MKISTSFLFDRATERMSSLQNKLATTQSQLSASKQVLSPSDSPEQAAAITRLQGQIDRQDSHSKLLKTSLNRYKAEETALRSANDLLIRLKELGVQAANDALGPSERKSVGVEMQAIRDQLVSLGNTQDDSGNYLFSGTRVSTAAFGKDSQGHIVYQGDQTPTQIPAGVERTVQYSRSGTDVFSRVVRSDKSSVGFFDALDQMISSVNSSNTSGIQQGLADLSQMHDSLTLSQAESGSDQNVVQQQLDGLDETTLRLKSSLSDVQDLDYTAAVTRMNKEMMALQAAMSSFSKISSLSLFQYIN